MRLATCSFCSSPSRRLRRGRSAAERAQELKSHEERGRLVTAQAERGKAEQERNSRGWVGNEKVSAIEFPHTGLSAPANVHIGWDELRGTQRSSRLLRETVSKQLTLNYGVPELHLEHLKR